MVIQSDLAHSPEIHAKSIVLVGLMGAGKSSVGRRLAQKLELPFVDADREIENAAGCTIPEFFERFGEEEFRRGERRVIQRILDGPPVVLATGGGAFMAEDTREAIAAHAVSLWLKADLDVLFERVSRRQGRPLLAKQNPRAVLEKLMEERYPVYALADLEVESRRGPIEMTVDKAYEVLMAYLDGASEAVPAE
ncbi:shikimate kinase [Nisaea acidiphila]|uniref:Shikimate kinase n=1 Tax=Nisaea acidiphila TaxID=1862145 RepID=A0A9J7AY06_9PROT|nr:shikimate kinase [Nisaea acidiphila]UUX51682.1 shikimate kinase [Nisaea acidiphila]